MNGFGQDIDNKRALPWKAKHIQFSAEKASTKQEMLDVIESSLKEFTDTVYGNHNDQKYSRLVDLIMLRFKSDLNELPIAISFSCDYIKQLVIQSLDNAYDASENYVKYDDAVEDIISKLKLLADNDDSSNQKTSSYQPKFEVIEKRQKLKDSIELNDIAEKHLQNVNDLICSISVELSKQFAKLEDLVMRHLTILTSDKYDSNVIDTVERLKELQLGPVAIDIKSQKKAAKKKQKAVDIIVAGMKFNSKMIDTLSTSAIKTVMHSAIAVKKHYHSISTALCIVELYVKENLKYTIDLVNDAFGKDSILKKIQKFIGRIVNLVVNEFIKPLMANVIEIFKTPLKELVIDWLLAHQPEVVKSAMKCVNKFLDKAKKVFRRVKRTWSIAKRWIRKSFFKAAKMFRTAMSTLKSWFVSALRFFWHLIWGAIKLACSGTVWLVRQAGALAAAGWRALKNTKFGKKLVEFGDKVAKPFRAVKAWIQTGYNKVKTKIIDIRHGLSNKFSSLVNGIKSRASAFFQNAKQAFIKTFQSLRQWFANSLRFIVNIIYKAINKILFRIPEKIALAISARLAGNLSRNALQKSGGSFLSRAIRWLVQKFSTVFSKLSIGGIFKTGGKFLGQLFKFGWKALLKAASIIGWYLLVRDIIEVMHMCGNEWLLRQMRLGGISHEDMFWIEKVLGFMLLRYYFEFLLDPVRLWNSIVRFTKYLSGMFMNAYENMLNACIKKDAIEELNKESNLRCTLYSKSRTPLSAFTVPALAEINDIDKEFTFIHSQFKLATGIYNYLKTTTSRMYNDYLRMQEENQFDSGNTYEDYWAAKIDYSKGITKLLEALMPTGIDVFTGGILGLLLNEDVKEDHLMLIYHEMMCGIEYIEWWKANKRNHQNMLEQLSQLKEFFKNREIDIDSLQEICSQQQKQQSSFFSNAQALNDFIVSHGKEAIKEINKIIYGEDSADESQQQQNFNDYEYNDISFLQF